MRHSMLLKPLYQGVLLEPLDYGVLFEPLDQSKVLNLHEQVRHGNEVSFVACECVVDGVLQWVIQAYQ